MPSTSLGFIISEALARCPDVDKETVARDAQDILSSGGIVDAILEVLPPTEEPWLLEKISETLEIDPLPQEFAEGADRDKLLEAISPSLAIRHRFLPVQLIEPNPETGELGELWLGCYDPLDMVARASVARASSIPIRYFLGNRREIVQGLQLLYGVGAETFEEILAEREMGENGMIFNDEASVIDGSDEDALVVRFVNQIIREALSRRATDIHIEPTSDDLRVRYRIDGLLKQISVPPNIKELHASVISRIKVMAKLDITEKRLPQDGRIYLAQRGGDPIDVRVATIPSVEGESVSLRLLGREHHSLASLGLSSTLTETFRNLLAQQNGIVLVTGPTGSGKSTTLYAALAELNSEERRIVTIEDPVEHKLPGVVQIAVRPEVGLTFASGLRSVLRGDPNVIMVGEIRDVETAQIAIRSSLTGHLVFSTLHTNDAVSAINRLMDMGVEPYLISSSVRAVVAQRLVRQLCEKCKTPQGEFTIPGTETTIQTMHPSGNPCENCGNSGYRGRLAIFEVCHLGPHLQEAVSRSAAPEELVEAAEKEGYEKMIHYGWEVVTQGLTTPEEILLATS